MTKAFPRVGRAGWIGLALLVSACAGPGGLDWDLRSRETGFNTTEAARQATADRPRADARGVISYPGYQVAIARRGDTVAAVAGRLGLSATELGRVNAIAPEVALRSGEVLVLPGRIAEPAGVAAAGTLVGAAPPGGGIDVTTLAGDAIARAEGGTPAARPRPDAPSAIVPGPQPAARPAPPGLPGGKEPVRHRVARGETAFTVARRYNVTTRALADWNGLGPELMLREGQTLLIPVAADTPRPAAAAEAPVTAPGQGSPTPEPPSAAQPLPPAPAAAPATPPSPDLGASRSAASAARFAMPADGNVIRSFSPPRNQGIDIGAAAGSPVRAAADGTVAKISRDTASIPIVMIRHPGNLLTVYANVDGISVAEGAAVRRGQQIGTVRAGSPAFLHFEVRDGIEAQDPMTFLQ